MAAVALAAAATACSQPAGPVAKMTPNPTNTFEAQSRDDALPPGFPSSVPLPGERTVIYSATASFGVVAYLRSPSSRADLKRFYLQRFSSWVLHSCTVAPGQRDVTVIVASKDGRLVTVAIGDSPEYGARVGGDPYDLFVSVSQAAPPASRAEPC